MIETLDGTSLSALNRYAALDGVTIDGTVGVYASSSITLLNSLTLNGQLVIATQSGGYTQSASGALLIDIRGLGQANHGKLTATESVSLAGSLSINLVEAYEPEIGDLFTIVNGASITGTFDTINGLVIGNGKQFNVIYSATEVIVEVIFDS